MFSSAKRRRFSVAHRMIQVCCLSWMLCTSTSACTIFVLVDEGTVLLGNSEDFIKRGAIWFVPGDGDRFGRINVGFHNSLGVREDFAQGSMNEAGLAFDAAVLAKVPWEPDPGRETVDNLPDKIMDECATVAEAVTCFEKYNCRYLEGAQFLFADATGDAAIVAWMPEKGLSVVRRSGKAHLIATNTRLEPSGYRCQRWVRAHRELEGGGPPFERAQKALNGIHQHGPRAFTSYSCIYDLKRRKVRLYALANFEEMIEVDLREELKKETETVLMKDLFQNLPELAEIRAKPQRNSYGTRISLTSQELAAFDGTFSPEVASDIRVQVEATSDGLMVHNPGQPTAELFAESATTFRLAPDRGTVTFHMGEDGSVTGLTLHKQQDVYARRIE